MKAKLIFTVLLGFITALMFVGCEGDIGPQGPVGATGAQGPQGVQGPAGSNGADGADGQGTQNCMECHGSNQVITTKVFHWEVSNHAIGGTYVRNNATCSACHTSQGFLDRIATGSMSASGTIEEPLPINCYTCHEIHQTYTDADWALTSQDPITLWVGGATVDIGTGNQCINCHQARVPSPALPAPGDAGMFNLTNKRYGPHHGAQGMAFTGEGGFEIGEGYSNSVHTAAIQNSCTTCHMATVEGGRETGGHTFKVAFKDEDGDLVLNANGCVMCHSDTDALETLVEDTQTEIGGLLNQLGTKLNELGLIDDELEYAVVPNDVTAMQLGIIWNYQYVKEDQSLGVHNYKYVKTLLENSLAALN